MKKIATAFMLAIAFAATVEAGPQRKVAFTFDDLPGVGAGCNYLVIERINQKLIASLR